MQQLELRVKEIEEALMQPDMYESQNRQKMEELTRERADLSGKLAQTEEQWLLISEELEVLAQEIAR